MSDNESENILVKYPYYGASAYHIPDKGEPECNAHLHKGSWQLKPVKDIPGGITRCRDCYDKVRKRETDGGESGETLLSKARNGSPEDFGLSSFPDGEDR